MLTLAETIASVSAIVFERGEDFVYVSPRGDDTCWYTVEGVPAGSVVPSCLVGCFLYKHDLQHNIIEGAFVTDLGLGYALEDDAIEFLRTVQAQQDIGVPWGEALKYGICVAAGVEMVEV